MDTLRVLLRFTLLLIVTNIVQGATQCSKKNVIARLQCDLLCGYDKTLPPLMNSTSVLDIGVKLWLQFVRFDNVRNVLEVHCWSMWFWKDEFLHWEPTKYDGITTMKLNSKIIWIPETVVHSSPSGDAGEVFKALALCFLWEKGDVQCSYPTKYESYCEPDLTHWPFDTQNCTLQLSSGALDTRVHLNFTLHGAVSTETFISGRDWRLRKIHTTRFKEQTLNASVPVLRYDFLIQRLSKLQAATVVAPALVLTIITLLAFCLPLLCRERILVLGVAALVHCLFLQYLGSKLQFASDVTPLIVQFYRDSLLITSGALLLTVAGKRMVAGTGEYPRCMQGSIRWLTGLGLVKETDKRDSWLQLMLLLDRVAFTVFLVVLISFIVHFLS